jgi:predicted TIM-barrel fold metal-dependent hydrolase
MVGEWPYKNLRFKTADELTAEMCRLGIERAFVFDSRSWLHAPFEGNSYLLEATKVRPNLIPVLALTPLLDQEFGGKQCVLETIEKNGVGAIRLFPFDQSFTLNLWNVEKLFTLLNQSQIPIFIECLGLNGNIDSSLPQLYDLATNFQNTPIVLLNPGYRRLRILYELFERCSNIYVDTCTLISYHGIEDVVKHFGSNKLLYGSRMPFMEASASLGRLIYAELEPADRENIAWRNALSLLQGNKLYHGSMN